jgi:hypothetical protein
MAQCKHEADSDLELQCKKGHRFCLEKMCADFEPVRCGREDA